MKLTPCPFCAKPIPARMSTCPYCHRDEKGAPVVMDSQISPSAASELAPKDIERELADLANEDPYTREQAMAKLALYGLRVTLALMAVLTEHKRTGLPAVAKTLGMIADKRSIGALAQAAKQADDTLRIAAIWALAQFRDADVLPALLREAEHTHPITQSYLAHILGNFNDPSVVPVLNRLVSHGSPEVSYQAIFALGNWNEEQAIAVLKRAARRRDTLQRAAALESLKRLGVSAPLFRSHARMWGSMAVIGAALAGGLLFWFHK